MILHAMQIEIKYINDQQFYKEANTYVLQSTTLKNSDINQAIECLQKAIKIFEDNGSYFLDTYLKLASYLALANRLDEAKSLLKSLLINGLPDTKPHRKPITDARIYDKWRIIHSKAKIREEVLLATAMNWICNVYQLLVDDPYKELPWYRSSQAREALCELVKYRKSANIGLVDYIMRVTENPISYDLEHFETEVRRLL